HVGQRVVVMKKDGTQKSFRITKLFGFIGLQRVEIKDAKAGDVVAVSGLDDINIGETICPEAHPEALPILRIDEPTLQIKVVLNNTLFIGKDVRHITSSHIAERLLTQ